MILWRNQQNHFHFQDGLTSNVEVVALKFLMDPNFAALQMVERFVALLALVLLTSAWPRPFLTCKLCKQFFLLVVLQKDARTLSYFDSKFERYRTAVNGFRTQSL